ncbi:MAG: acyl-CoA dehydrogenase family protein [Acidimicrobiia bacterium]|nr:acyl-CoA dehydrogenase family protein [Acidimicrobiia bacterium]
MDFETPPEIVELLARIDQFIEDEIKPLENQDDNIRFFDHRREHARTNWDEGGVPRQDWYDLLREMRRRADRAGFLRWALPKHLGGSDGNNLGMAMIREHLAAKGLGLHNDLQNESSIVGNFPTVLMVDAVGNDEQRTWAEKMITGEMRLAFGLTEPDHGSDATWLETTAYRDGDEWVINGKKRFNTGLDTATHDMIFARTSGNQGEANGITCFVVPTDTPGFNVDFMWWTFNMPSEHAELTLDNVRVSGPNCILGGEGKGLEMANMFVHENRIRQAASGVGAAQYCIDESIDYAKQRTVFGRPLWRNQAVQFPLAEMQTRCEMVRNLVYKTAWHLDRNHHMAVSDKVSMANYQGNRLVCEAADLAIQVHGGIGYTRHKQFEHIYRHHRRYRITEGSEEIQIRRVAQRMFGVDVKRPDDPNIIGRSAPGAV